MSCREGTRQVWFKSLVATVVTALGVSHLAVTTLVWVTDAEVPRCVLATGVVTPLEKSPECPHDVPPGGDTPGATMVVTPLMPGRALGASSCLGVSPSSGVRWH